MYQFCGDADGMTRSRYYGASKDIYAMDHFMAAFAQYVPGFMLLEGYEILDSQDLSDGRCIVRVAVTQRGRTEASEYAFVMVPAPPP